LQSYDLGSYSGAYIRSYPFTKTATLSQIIVIHPTTALGAIIGTYY